MGCRLPDFTAACAQGRSQHSWNPGRRPSKQRCDYCKVNRQVWSRRYKFCDPIERAMQDLVSYGLAATVEPASEGARFSPAFMDVRQAVADALASTGADGPDWPWVQLNHLADYLIDTPGAAKAWVQFGREYDR